MTKKRRFKKRYIPFIIFLIFLGISKSGLLSFRKSEATIQKEFQKINVSSPQILFYEDEKEKRTTRYLLSRNDTTSYLVVMLHGSPGSSTDYIDFFKDEKLLEKAQLLSIDRAGFGYSNFGRSEPSLKEQVDLSIPIIKKHGKHKKIILVGHSYGGPFICKLAMDYPNLIDGLVIIAGSIAPELEPYEPYRKWLNFPIIRWIIPTAFKVSNQEILPLKKELKNMLSFWNNIQVPVVVIQGENDGFVPKENANFAKKMLINSPLVDIDIIPNGDHFILWSEHQKIVEKILTLL